MTGLTTRGPAPSSQKLENVPDASRTPRRAKVFVASVLLIAAALAGTADAAEGDAILLESRDVRVAAVRIHGVGMSDAAPLTAEVAAVIDQYLDGAVVRGLRTGKPQGAGGAFTPAARARLTSEDRELLVEEDVRRPGVVWVRRARAELDVLTGPGNVAEVVVATISSRVEGWGGGTGQIRVERNGELVLVRREGAWRIDGYELEVDRQRDPLPPLSLLWPFEEAGA